MRKTNKEKAEKRVMDRTCVITTLLCLAPIFLGLALYNRLPDPIPSHFDVNGEVNGYMSKPFMVFLMPTFMAAINLICNMTLEADPKRRNYPMAMKHITKWLIPVICWICISISFLKGLGTDLPVSTICMLLVSFVFIVFGNYLPKCRQNDTMGIKTPWTLYSEENWKRTHHMAGYVWIVSGLLMLVGTFFARSTLVNIILPIGLALTPIPYSYYLYRKGI